MTLTRSRLGDLICVLYGGDWPFVLRPDELQDQQLPSRSFMRVMSSKSEERVKCTLIGNAFHSEMMEGQLLEQPFHLQAQPKTFVLI